MSFLLFKRTTAIPPSGYYFKDPDTGYEFTGSTNYPALLKSIRDYRERNNLPELEDLHFAVQDCMCNLPINKRAGICRESKELEGLTLSQFISGGTYYLNRKIKKWFGIDDKESGFDTIVERRSICSKCPFNVPIDDSQEGASIRFEIKKLMDKEFKHIKTDYDDNLGICAACNCSIEYKTCLPERDVANSVNKMAQTSRDKLPRMRKEVITDFNTDGELFTCYQYRDFRKFYGDK